MRAEKLYNFGAKLYGFEQKLYNFRGKTSGIFIETQKVLNNEILFNIKLGSLTNYVYLCTCNTKIKIDDEKANKIQPSMAQFVEIACLLQVDIKDLLEVDLETQSKEL